MCIYYLGYFDEFLYTKRSEKTKKKKKKRIFLNGVLEVASSGCLASLLLLLFNSWVQKKRKGKNGNVPASKFKGALKVAERGRHGFKSSF